MHGVPDDDSAVVDLRDLHLEEAQEDLRVGARQDHLRALCHRKHLDDHGPDPLPLLVGLGAGLFAQRQESLRFPDVHDDVRALVSLHDAVDHLADLLRVLVVDVLALRLADLLQDDLLRGLGRDAPENVGRLRQLHRVVELERLVDGLRLLERDLQRRVLHGLDHALDGEDLDQAGLGIEAGVDILVGLVVLAGSGHHRVFQGGHDDLGVDVLFLADLLDGLSDDV